MSLEPRSHRVLIIAHHFPPSTVAATFRPLRLAKYLPELGHKVWVATLTQASYTTGRVDSRLVDDIPAGVKVMRIPNPNPLTALEKRRRLQNSVLSTKAAESNSDVRTRKRLKTFLAELAKFPDQDGAWIAMSVLPALYLILRNRIDLIVSSGPPFGAHIIALILQKLTGRAWVAQYGNPWTGNPSISWEFRTFEKMAEWFDRRILRNADVVIGIDKILIDCVYKLGRDHNVYMQPNGYDPAHFSPTDLPAGRFTVTYAGSLYNVHDPKVVYQALDIINSRRPDIRSDMKVIFVGPLASHEMARDAPADIEFTGPVPHAKLVEALNASHILLDFLTADNSMKYSTSCKIYEYMAARRPILVSAPDGMQADHVRDLNLGIVVPPDDPMAIARALIQYYSDYKSGNLKMPDSPGIEAYSAPVQAKELIQIVDCVCFGDPGEQTHEDQEPAEALSSDLRGNT